MSKACTKCKEEKPLDAFSKHKNSLRSSCRKCCAAYDKMWHKDNESAKLKSLLWRKNNPEKFKATARRWAVRNPEKVRRYKRNWEKADPERLKEKEMRKRIEIAKDPSKSKLRNLRTLLLKALKSPQRESTTMKLVGCSKEELIAHFESLFTEGMTWENHGLHGWHVDHIKPCLLFDFTKEEDIIKCFHYTNLQPLWAEDNYKKGVAH